MHLVSITPTRGQRLLLALVPFLLLAVAYGVGSSLRLAENPDDRLLPALATMTESFGGMATEVDYRSGEVLLWSDTLASLQRLLLGVGIAALLALVLGTAQGMLPVVGAPLSPFMSVLSMVPPMALLPILFISLGVDEVSKVALIVIGVAPVMVRDLEARVRELPREQTVKALTLGASTWLLALRVVLPQVLPRLIDSVRLGLGSAWLFLISAEAIASTEGLGYRIFLVRRYLAMDVIIPYVVWITLIAFLLDRLLRYANGRAFPWYARVQGGGR